MNILDTLAYLQSVDVSDVKRIAEGSGVSPHTLRKIVTQETKDPGVQTLAKVAEWLSKQVPA